METETQRSRSRDEDEKRDPESPELPGQRGGYTEVHDSEDRAHAHTTALQCLVPRSCSCLDVLTLTSVLDHKFLEKKDSILFT